MKLIIDIPRKKYEWIKIHNQNIDDDSIVGAVANGMPYEERPKGKWIKEDKPWGGFGDCVLVNTCPFCKESFVYHGNDPKFCPNCGAEMEADNDKS